MGANTLYAPPGGKGTTAPAGAEGNAPPVGKGGPRHGQELYVY
jgi:hypothetical protein